MDALRSILTVVESPDEQSNRWFLAARDLVRAAPPESLSDTVRIPALLALGDHGAALDRLRALRALSGPPPDLLATYATWTGDQRWLAQLGADSLRDISGPSPPPGGGAAEVLQRWRGAADPISPARAAELVTGAIVSLWGILPNAAGQSVGIEPTLPDDWQFVALRNLRIGETLLDLVLRRTRHGMMLTVSRTRGPAMRVLLTMAGIQEFDVDGETLTGGRAVFRVESESAVTMQR